MKILLSEWAARHYSPAPSLWVLRQWVRRGEIYPAPEKVGKAYHVEETARRGSYEQAPQDVPAGTEPIAPFDWRPYVFTLKDAVSGAREFYNPHGVGCGVYLVMERDLKSCAYVGSSVQLSNRLRNQGHLPADAPTFAFEVPQEHVRDVEATYWEALAPRLNRKSPPGNVLAKEMVQAIRREWKC